MTGRVVVVGSINADIVVGSRVLPRAGETVLGDRLTVGAGGKGANQAVAAARAGARATLVGCVGTDLWADVAMAFLESTAVDLTRVRCVDAPTGVAVVAVAHDGENSIVVVPGANGWLTAEQAAAGVAEVEPGDVVVTQLEVAGGAVRAALTEARRRGATTVLNPSPVIEEAGPFIELADIVVVNEVEADALSIDTPTRVRTLGERGAEIGSDGRVTMVPGRPVSAVDTTGAGDCFLGVLAARLASGEQLVDATRHACVAASLQVERPGAATAMPTAAEITAAMEPALGT